MLKRFILLILTLALTASIVCGCSFSSLDTSSHTDEIQVTERTVHSTDNAEHDNTKSSDVAEVTQAPYAESEYSVPTEAKVLADVDDDIEEIEVAEVEPILAYDEAIEIIRQNMVDRIETFSLIMPIFDDDISVELDKIYEDATAHTGVPNEGDYILLHLGDFNVHRSWADASRATYEFTINYSSSYKDEEYVTEQVNNILASLDVYSMSNDADKVHAIYTWMTQNIAYDYDIDKTDSTVSYTAYGALANRKAVCQGCSALLYRMLLESGIDCRCIGGLSDGIAHEWNIVNIYGTWYDTDVTWDLGYDENDFWYLLSGSDEFDKDHQRYGDYMTEEFLSMYPVSTIGFGQI